MFPRLPTVTKALLIANAILFLLQQPFLLGMQTFEPFMLQPLQQGFDAFSPGGNFQPWQLLTYGFLHGSFGHLFFNMLAVFMFGAPLEQTWGEKRFLLYYLVCVWPVPVSASCWWVRCWRTRPRCWVPLAACSACCWPTACCSRTSG